MDKTRNMNNATLPSPTKRQKQGDTQDANDNAAEADEAAGVPAVLQGVVVWYNDEKGYGFINAQDEQFFVRENALRFASGVPEWGRRLMTGEYVQFTPGQPHGGRTRARQALGVTGAWGGLLLVEHGDVRFHSYSRAGLPESVFDNADVV